MAQVPITAWRRRCDLFGRGMMVLRDAFGMAVGVIRVMATAIGGMKVSAVLWRAGARGGGRSDGGVCAGGSRSHGLSPFEGADEDQPPAMTVWADPGFEWRPGGRLALDRVGRRRLCFRE